MSIYRTYKINEESKILQMMWDVLLRATEDDNGNAIDDTGCDWFTVGNKTYIGGMGWLVSNNPEVANLVNAINALKGYTEFINANPKDFQIDDIE